MHAEAVDHAVAEQESGVDTERPAGCRDEAFNLSGRSDQCSQAERDAGCDRHLAQQIEPARHPRRKRSMFFRSKNGRPKVWTSGRRDCRHDLSHAQANEHGEKGDDDPANGHNAGAAREQAILEERRYAGDDGLDSKFLEKVHEERRAGGGGTAYNDGKGDAKVVQHRPVTLELLLVTQFRQSALIRRLGTRHVSIWSTHIVGHCTGSRKSCL